MEKEIHKEAGMNDRMKERLDKVQRLDGVKDRKRRKPKMRKKEIERFNEVEGMPNKSELADMVQAAINEFCDTYDVESMRKEAQPIWGACCTYVGERVIKRTGYIRDRGREREARIPGTLVYDDDRITECLELWSFLCGVYAKVPLILDFCGFCGVSNTLFYEDGLSPKRARCAKLLHTLQEGGATRHIIDGKCAPIGTLAFLNHFYGWNTYKDVSRNNRVQAVTASELPKLGELDD